MESHHIRTIIDTLHRCSAQKLVNDGAHRNLNIFSPDFPGTLGHIFQVIYKRQKQTIKTY